MHVERVEDPRHGRPGIAPVGSPVRAGPAERPHPDALALPQDRVCGRRAGGGRLHLHAERAVRRDDVLVRRTRLLAGRGRELGRGDERAEHGHDRGVVGEIDLREVVDQGGRRVVGHEPDGELAGDALRGRRVVREVAEVRRRDRLPVSSSVRVAEVEDGHRAGPVRVGVVVDVPRLPHVDAVAGQDPCGVLDVGLGVAGGPADGVKLEELAAEVLVRRPLGGHGVAEVHAHRRMGDRLLEQGVEPAECVPPDHPAVVRAEQRDPVGVAGRVQVVLPEAGHRLEDLPRGVHPAQHRPPLVVRVRDPDALGAGAIASPQVLGTGVDREPPRRRGGVEGVGDRRRVELAREPPVDAAGGGHLGGERRRPATGEPVEDVQRPGVQDRWRRGHGRRRPTTVPPPALPTPLPAALGGCLGLAGGGHQEPAGDSGRRDRGRHRPAEHPTRERCRRRRVLRRAVVAHASPVPD